jgi:catechol 2,3-dioxygenase-like lactoylglutathione lyase family enzyme
MLGADDLDAAKRFYDAALGALGVDAGTQDDRGRLWYRTQRGTFAVTKPINGEAASCANGSTIGFLARTPEAVQAGTKPASRMAAPAAKIRPASAPTRSAASTWRIFATRPETRSAPFTASLRKDAA